MRFAIAFTLLTLGLAPTSGRAQAAAAKAGSDAEQQVLVAEDQYVAAEIARDESALRRLVDDRFVHNRPDGTTRGKEEFIQAVLKMNMAGQRIRERTVLLEDDVAVVFGTAEIRFTRAGKEDHVATLRYTSTYVNRRGSWRLLALQMQSREAAK